MVNEKRLARTDVTILGLAVLLILGLGVRLWGIQEHGLWIDEIATAECLEYDLLTLFDCRRAALGSPVFHVATNIVYTLLGRPPLPAPEWLVRLPELIAGTLTIPAAWLAARQVLGRRGAWLNAVLWTFAPTAVAYSQEARMYAWLMLFSNLSTWLFLVALDKRSWRWGAAFGVAAALNFYSHYLAVFVIAAQFLYGVLYFARAGRDEYVSARTIPPEPGGKNRAVALFARPSSVTRRLLVSILCAGVVFAVLLVPWLSNILRAAQVHVLSTSYTSIPLSPPYLADALSWILLNQVELPAAALVLLLLGILGGWWMFRWRRAGLMLIGCWLAVTFAFLLYRQAGFSSFRYWMVVQPPVYWLLSAGGLALAEGLASLLEHRRILVQRSIPYAVVTIVGVLALAPFLARFFTDPFESYRFDDWRGAAQFLRTNAKPGDLVIAFGDSSVYHKMGFNFYLPPGTVSNVLLPNELNGQAVAHAREKQGRAWGIVYAREAEIAERLRTQGADRVDIQLFKGLALVSPRPELPQETVLTGVERLVEFYHAWDPERFEFAGAILRDDGAGDNLLANPQLETRKKGMPLAWKSGATRAQVISSDAAQALALTSRIPDGSATAQQQLGLSPGRLYILRFECKNSLTSGAQRTYVTFDRTDKQLIVYPNGAGDVCPNKADWEEHAFVLRAPSPGQAAPTATVLLRNAGIGDAMWRNISLYAIPLP